MDETQRADLHAFERRFQEILHQSETTQCKWYKIIAIMFALFAYGCMELYNDYQANPSRSIVEYLEQNLWFSFSTCLLLIMIMGVRVFERATSRSIYLERTRRVLYDYALSCLDDGRLLLLPYTDGYDHYCQYLGEPPRCIICDNADEDDYLCIPEEDDDIRNPEEDDDISISEEDFDISSPEEGDDLCITEEEEESNDED